MDIKKQNSAGLTMVVAAALASLAVGLADSPRWAPTLVAQKTKEGVRIECAMQAHRPGFVAIEWAPAIDGPWTEISRSDKLVVVIVPADHPARFFRGVFVKHPGGHRK